MQEIKISLAKYSDLEKIFNLEKIIFKNYWTKSNIKSSFEQNDIFIVIKEKKQVIGYAICQKIIDEFEILRIAIAPNYRKLGLASMLLEFTEKIANQISCKKIILEVSSKNLPAFNFYQKFKFTEVGIRKNYYAQGENAILMDKLL